MNNKKRKAVIKKTVSNMTSRSKKTSSEKEESWLNPAHRQIHLPIKRRTDVGAPSTEIVSKHSFH